MNNISEMLLNKIFRKYVSVSHGLQSDSKCFFLQNFGLVISEKHKY